jgi:hypothetical protein
MAEEEVQPTSMTEERQRQVDLFFLPLRRARAYVAWLGQVRDQVIRGIQNNEGFANWIIDLVKVRLFGGENPAVKLQRHEEAISQMAQEVNSMVNAAVEKAFEQAQGPAQTSPEDMIRQIKEAILKDPEFAKAFVTSPLVREARAEAQQYRQDDRRRYITQHLAKALGMAPEHVNPDLVEIAFSELPRGRVTEEKINDWLEFRRGQTEGAIRRVLRTRLPKRLDESIASMRTVLSLTALNLEDDAAVQQAILDNEREDQEAAEAAETGEEPVPISPYFRKVKEEE